MMAEFAKERVRDGRAADTELKMNAVVGEYEASKSRVAVSKKCGADK
jgi:hypothetical protein